MKKICLAVLFFQLCNTSSAQIGLNLGVKAGFNFSTVTHASDINAQQYTGYMIGGYIAPKPKKLLGFRSEIILSRQGYNFHTNSTSGDVVLDYLLLPQLVTINFTKRIQLHGGLLLAFLLNTGVDSTGNGSNGSLFNYLKRFDYGLAGGGEITPIGGFFIGGRVNFSLQKVRRDGSGPDYIPGIDARNNVVQVYAGWRF
ncbi:MAG: outer membrane beta-barrel protein [Chitinophagaceae bacterium]|nr:PorT family protein [Chitinophagaceae bacterium]